MLWAHIRNNFWPVAGQRLAKQTVRECLICVRYTARNPTPLMSNLPKSRVTPSLPFSEVGVDYAGPLYIKDPKGRGYKKINCYLSLPLSLFIITIIIHLLIHKGSSP